MKYIRLKNDIVLLFSNDVSHNSMAKAEEAVSAGFVKLTDGKIHTYGYSHSLDIGSHPEDHIYIEIAFKC